MEVQHFFAKETILGGWSGLASSTNVPIPYQSVSFQIFFDTSFFDKVRYCQYIQRSEAWFSRLNKRDVTATLMYDNEAWGVKVNPTKILCSNSNTSCSATISFAAGMIVRCYYETLSYADPTFCLQDNVTNEDSVISIFKKDFLTCALWLKSAVETVCKKKKTI